MNVKTLKKPKTILIADDEEQMRVALSQIVESGFQDIKFVFAGNGIDAEKILLSHDIDAAILDEKMPGKNGSDILSTAISQNLDIPIIIVTGYSNLNINLKALKNGAYYFINKPFQIDEINHTLKNAFLKREMFYENMEKYHENYTKSLIDSLHNAAFNSDVISVNTITDFAKSVTTDSLIVTISNIFAKMVAMRFNAEIALIIMRELNSDKFFAFGVEGFIPSYRYYNPLNLESQSIFNLKKLRDILPQDKMFFTDNDVDVKIKNTLATPINFQGENIGLIKIINCKCESFDFYDLDTLNRFSDIFKHILTMLGFSRTKEGFIRNTLRHLPSIFEKISQCTPGHSERVGKVSKRIAKQMGLSETFQEQIELAGILHDIGKIAIPIKVLMKKDKLEYEDFKQIKKHPFLSALFIKSVLKNDILPPIVYHHHENYDGTGYPTQISGENIPIGSRIIRVADAYDAMLNQRIYKPRMNQKEAVEELIRYSKYDFDPEVVTSFLTTLKKIKR